MFYRLSSGFDFFRNHIHAFVARLRFSGNISDFVEEPSVKRQTSLEEVAHPAQKKDPDDSESSSSKSGWRDQEMPKEPSSLSEDSNHLFVPVMFAQCGSSIWRAQLQFVFGSSQSRHDCLMCGHD